jgi:predicted component of type VI protein secretion system
MPDANLIRLCGEIVAIHRESYRLSGENGEDIDANYAAIKPLVDAERARIAEVASTPAMTLDGQRGKAAVLRLIDDDELSASLVADVLRAA